MSCIKVWSMQAFQSALHLKLAWMCDSVAILWTLAVIHLARFAMTPVFCNVKGFGDVMFYLKILHVQVP